MELDAKQSALDDWKWETTHWADKALILIPCISWTPRGDTKEPGLPNKICCKDDEEIQQCVRWLRTHREKIKFERKLTQMLCNVNHQSILHWRWWLWPWDEVCKQLTPWWSTFSYASPVPCQQRGGVLMEVLVDEENENSEDEMTSKWFSTYMLSASC